MRAFVAVDVPSVRQPPLVALRPEDHVTLEFFADLPEGQLRALVYAMRDVSASEAPFDLEIRGIGAFPDAGRPRVLWAAVGAGTDRLHQIVGRLREALEARGISSSPRPYVPHLTLARLRSARDVTEARRLLTSPELASWEWGRSRVSELILKESLLLPSGVRHTVRARSPLGAPARTAGPGG